MIKIFFQITILLISFSTPLLSSNSNIFIFLTVNDTILTNYDIQKESEYLKILNPNLENLNNDQIFIIAKNSLIDEIVKKKEIEKNLNFEKDNPFVNQYFKDYYTSLNFENEKQFEASLKDKKNYSIEEIKEKLKIEILWNELIFKKYERQVKINKKDLLKKIENINSEMINEFNLSEIVFQNQKGKQISQIINEIKNSINEIGFNNTANIYSISDSFKKGGKIGWINENNLSKIIFEKLKNINEGQNTEVIQIGNNYLILKIEKIRKIKKKFNKDEELKRMIKFETNKQLNRFSKIYFDKAKINYSINEK